MVFVLPSLRTRRVCSLLLTLILGTVTLSFVSLTPVSGHGTVDQHWDPPHPGTGSAIRFHSPIGQSFTPTLDNIVGVDVSILNDPNLDQSMTTPNTWNWIHAHTPIGQSFKPINPLFTEFAVYLENTAGADRGMIMWLKSGSIAGATLAAKAFVTRGPGAQGF